ncbi:hypothetical protein PanWU01x14_084290 [Parasponia andersonii]|uniref:Uncharacterized protein n=1 Tax=Parasponia andersonii TaxID=3476 RepID=A0A2P5D9K0_PARAD|nr:hypothetical protein PanWU01x14_084290 [Parasponia andersonii]
MVRFWCLVREGRKCGGDGRRGGTEEEGGNGFNGEGEPCLPSNYDLPARGAPNWHYGTNMLFFLPTLVAPWHHKLVLQCHHLGEGTQMALGHYFVAPQCQNTIFGALDWHWGAILAC